MVGSLRCDVESGTVEGVRTGDVLHFRGTRVR
jgi:hypothetical protein